MIVLPDAKDRAVVYSFLLTKHRNVTDGQADIDRETEMVWLLQRSVLRAMQTRCKNDKTVRSVKERNKTQLCFVA